MTLTYRGQRYDSDAVRQEYQSWWQSIHSDVSRWLKYRGIPYRACNHG